MEDQARVERILAESTPRPWAPSETDGDIVVGDARALCATAYDMNGRITEGDANRDLIVLAVNSYEANRQALKEAVGALEAIADPANPGSESVCDCDDHGTEDCCNSVGHYCPQCISATALAKAKAVMG